MDSGERTLTHIHKIFLTVVENSAFQYKLIITCVIVRYKVHRKGLDASFSATLPSLPLLVVG